MTKIEFLIYSEFVLKMLRETCKILEFYHSHRFCPNLLQTAVNEAATATEGFYFLERSDRDKLLAVLLAWWALLFSQCKLSPSFVIVMI